MAALSSLTMRRATTRCPPARISSISVEPDLSSASVRVSETVRTAMLTGRKGRDSSIRGIAAIRIRPLIEGGIGRPSAGGKRVEIGRGLAETHTIDPVVRQHVLGELA